VTLEDASRAIVDANPHAVERSAHRLKGSLSTMGATAAADTANRLESLTRDGALEGAAELCAQLCLEVTAVGQSLRLWKDQLAA
jgi:HPt (histidine-containing phosphotransfer) domain-containing protein